MATKILLDGRSISSEADFHDAIDTAARAVGFQHYGRNLDALWDVVTGLLEPPVQIRWIHASAARAALGPRFERILKVLTEAREELGRDFHLEIKP